VLELRGVPIVFDAAKQELSINGHRAAVPLRDGKLDVRLIVDRTAFELFVNDGLIYVPMPVIPAADNHDLSITARGGDVRVPVLDVYELRSIWE
ncbi:MAG: GH32 C-terminal domain-containing protein, partial [Pirellulales bacterium]